MLVDDEQAKAAEARHINAQQNLGVYYENIEKNNEQPKAAVAKNTKAQNDLGYYYEKIEKNNEQAKLWYIKAAVGDADAQSRFGMIITKSKITIPYKCEDYIPSLSQ